MINLFLFLIIHIRQMIKIQFVKKEIEFINLPNIFKGKSVISSFPTCFKNTEASIIFIINCDETKNTRSLLKDSRFDSQIIYKSLFLIGQVPIKKYGSKTLFFAIQHIEKVLLKYFPPSDQTNPFAYCCSFTFHTSYKNGMIGHVGRGGRCQIAQKQFIIKTYRELILYKPVGKYQSTMGHTRALFMIAYQKVIV